MGGGCLFRMLVIQWLGDQKKTIAFLNHQFDSAGSKPLGSNPFEMPWFGDQTNRLEDLPNHEFDSSGSEGPLKYSGVATTETMFGDRENKPLLL